MVAIVNFEQVITGWAYSLCQFVLCPFSHSRGGRM